MDRRTARVVDGQKYCTACEQRKPLDHFHTRTASPDGRHAYCKACRKEKRTRLQRNDPAGMRTCTLCSQVKSLDDFHPRQSGYQSWCKSCANYSAPQREYKLQSKYGIGLSEYAELLASQGGKCAICGTREPGTKGRDCFVVDHCHNSMKVRGLLCVSCNLLLGHAQDSPQVLQRAILYLSQSYSQNG